MAALFFDESVWPRRVQICVAREEEGEMFKKTGKVLSDEELESLGARMDRAKETQQKKASAQSWFS